MKFTNLISTFTANDATLKRDDVSVVHSKIRAVTPRGIVCDDNSEQMFDAILYEMDF